MNVTENTEMYAFFELQRKRVEELNKEACQALAEVFRKYGCPNLDLNSIHDLVISVSILHSYGYETPQQIHELMYRLGEKIKF